MTNNDAVPVVIDDIENVTRRYDFNRQTQEMPAVDLALLCFDCQEES